MHIWIQAIVSIPNTGSGEMKYRDVLKGQVTEFSRTLLICMQVKVFSVGNMGPA